MTQVKNQHYVPQSYLKNFSSDRTQIFVFDKFKQCSFISNVRNVASERFFYDFPQSVTQSEDVQVIERFFSELEARQDRFFRHLQRKINAIFALRLNSATMGKIYTFNVLTLNQKGDLALIAAIQLLRTKEFRKFIVEMHQATQDLRDHVLEKGVLDHLNQFKELHSVQISEELAEAFKSLVLEECAANLANLYSEGLAVLHAKTILDYAKPLLEILRNHIFIIGINDTTQPLFTSDHPVVRRPYLTSSGLDSEGIEVSFPINSKAIVIMRDKKYFHKYTDKESKLFPLTLEDVEHYNTTQVYESNRFVFCGEDKFELIRAVCKDRPEVCSESRNRIQVRRIESTFDTSEF